MVIGERGYYGIYQWSYLRLDLDVLYIRLFDLKKPLQAMKWVKTEDKSFCFQLVSVARPHLIYSSAKRPHVKPKDQQIICLAVVTMIMQAARQKLTHPLFSLNPDQIYMTTSGAKFFRKDHIINKRHILNTGSTHLDLVKQYRQNELDITLHSSCELFSG